MSAEDFGDFTCTGAEDGCTVDSGAVTCAEVSDCVPNAYDAITDIQDGSTTQKGVVQLATDGESTAGEVVNSNDSRLSNARTPSAHAATHVNGTDDIQSATAAQKGLATAAQITKLDGIEAGADVTDSTNVDAAGATMNADTDVSGNSWVLDEDAMGSNSAVKVPTQQSVKAYVDANAGKVTTYADVATAEAVDPADNDICYVVATESYYRAETTGSAYTDDNTYVLDTAGVTDERWLAISGKYNYEDVAMYVPRIVYSNASDSSGNPFIPELAYTEADGSTASFTLGQYTVFDTPLVRVPSVGDVSLLGSYRNAYATPFDGGSGGGTTFSTTYHSGFWTTTIIESATANLYTSGNSAWYKGYCPQSITDSVKIFLNTPPMAARISGQGVSLYVKFKLPATGGAGSYGQAVFGLTEATSGEDDQLSFGCRYKELTTDATTYTKFMVESYDSGAHKYRDATVVLGDGAWHTLVVDVKDTAWYAYLDNPNRTGGTGAASFSSAAQTSVTINDIDTWAAVFPYIEVYGGYQTLTAGTAYATQIEVEELFVTYGGSAF
jgi:hypothetical protein